MNPDTVLFITAFLLGFFVALQFYLIQKEKRLAKKHKKQ